MGFPESRIALVTGATQGLGRALVAGLARRMRPDDTVYLTGRDADRVQHTVAELALEHQARIRGEVFDVGHPDAARRFAELLRERHGGVDIVFGNATMRIGPDDDQRAIIDEYTRVNNFGTTRLLRAFAPLLRADGRLIVVASSFGTLYHLAPALHRHFDDLASLDDVDRTITAWRDAILDGSARAGAWPGFVNIPSKIGQVAAVRTLARGRRDEDMSCGILLAAVCPGLINTPTSGAWWDVSKAASPDEAAVALVDLALEPVKPAYYGELIRFGEVLPWAPSTSRRADSASANRNE